MSHVCGPGAPLPRMIGRRLCRLGRQPSTHWQRRWLIQDQKVRMGAAASLGRIGDPRGVRPLVGALSDARAGIRRTAVDSLGDIGDPRAVWPLLAALGDASENVRRAAAAALAAIGPLAVDPLIDALKSDEAQVSEAAVDSLGAIGDSRGIRPLLEILDHRSPAMREKAGPRAGGHWRCRSGEAADQSVERLEIRSATGCSQSAGRHWGRASSGSPDQDAEGLPGGCAACRGGGPWQVEEWKGS